MAANSASGTGHVPTGKKKKVKRSNRVDRFADWSSTHKAQVLDKLGISLDDFRSYGGGKKQRVLNRAFDAKGGGGGGGNPSAGGNDPSGAPAFDANDPAAFTAPMSYNQTLAQGRNAANLQYGPQQQILNQQASNIPSWFDQYRSSLQMAQAQSQAQNAPLIANAQTAAQNSGQTVLKDAAPGSEAAQNDALAAAARKSMGDMFANLLGANQQANTNYLAGRTDVANLSQTQAQNDNTAAKKNLAAEKGQYLTNYVGTQRENERKNILENAAFGLDQYKAESDAASDVANIKAKNNDVVTSGPFAGLTKKQIRNLTPAQKTSLRNKGKGPKGPSALDLAKYDVNKDGKLSPGEAVNAGGAGGAKDPYGNTPKQQRAANSTLKKARSVAGQITQKGDTWKDVYQLLVVKYPTGDSDTLKAAAIMSVHGSISPRLRKSLLKAGINPALLKSKVHAKKKPVSGRPGTAGNGNVSGTYTG